MQNFIRLADEECKAHALCYLDLEHFYDINDTCGHFAGDECLSQVGDMKPWKLVGKE